MSENVLYTLRDGIATVTLNRPESLNSLDLATIDALLARFRRAVLDAASVLILTGTGRAFCSGAALTPINETAEAQGDIDLGKLMRSHYNPLVRAMVDIEIPTVVAVNGLAVGGGMSLALWGDVVVAAHSAIFRQVFVDIGLIPDMGATWQMPRLVGRGQARGMALLGATMSAQQAKERGLIWDVVDDGQLLPEARRIAAAIAAKPRETVLDIRRALDRSDRVSLVDQLEYEADIQTRCGRRPAFIAAVRRFLSRGAG